MVKLVLKVMTFLGLTLLFIVSSGFASEVRSISGAGATFPYPVYSKWAAANADWTHAKGFYMVLTNQPGKDSWPITGISFILMHKAQKKADTAEAVLKFFDWAYHHGAKMVLDLDYIPMPANVIDLVETTWHNEILDADTRIIWK